MKAHLDLFSGIGGFAMAARWTGFTTVQFVEIEPFPQAVLRKNFPGVPIHADIQDFDARPLRGTISLITGGFPCQDISSAGKGAGLIEGKRSSLWFEYLRIIRECRPAFCLIENVPRLRTLGADRVLQDLEAAGYTAEAFVVGADDIGASHRRKRVWIVAYSRRRAEQGESNPEYNGGQDSQRKTDQHRITGPTVADAYSTRQSQQSGTVSNIGRRAEYESEAMADASNSGRNDAQSTVSGEHSGERARQAGRCGCPDFPPGPAGDWSDIPAEFWPVEPRVRVLAARLPGGLVRRRGDAGKRAAILKGLGNAIVPQVAALFLQWIGEQLDVAEAPL